MDKKLVGITKKAMVSHQNRTHEYGEKEIQDKNKLPSTIIRKELKWRELQRLHTHERCRNQIDK